MRPENGESFVIGPSEGALGTFWWTWGDLKEDLLEKKFRADEWYRGRRTKMVSRCVKPERVSGLRVKGRMGWG